jgi:dipeptidase E
MHRRLLLISNSTQHGSGYLEHCSQQVIKFFTGCKNIVFVPYALHDVDDYHNTARKAFENFGFPNLSSVHNVNDPRSLIENSDGIFIGGGNTFRLLNKMYEQDLLEVIRRKVFSGELRYMGTSAGTNVATVSIKTTNDMPIVYPPSFNSLELVPFQINAHYLDASNSTHMGETREKRIQEFHEDNDTKVVGIREGAMLLVENDSMQLIGQNGGKLFVKGRTPTELNINDDLSYLLKKE